MKAVHSRPFAAIELGQPVGAYANQSADLLAGILESADESFVALDANLRFVVFNATFRREFVALFGRAPQLGQGLLDTLAEFPEEQAAVADLARRAFGGEALALDRELTVAGAPTQVFEISLTPVLNANGTTVVVVAVARNITGQRDAESQFRRLVEASNDAMLIVHGELIDQLNARAETMFGYPPGALVGKPLDTVMPVTLRSHRRYAPAGRSAASGTRATRMLSGVRADGSRFPLEVSLSPLSAADDSVVAAAIRDASARRRNDEGLRQTIAELKGEVFDLTSRLAQAQQQLKTGEDSRLQAARQCQAAFDKAPIGVALTTPEMRIVTANAAFCETLGYGKEALQQLRLHDITHPDDIDADRALDARILSGDLDRYPLEKRFYRQDGRMIWGALAVSLRLDAVGGPENFVVALQDITQRKADEQELAETRLRLQLAVEIGRIGFWEWTPDSDATYCSPEWAQQIGLGADDVPASFGDWQARLHPDDTERVTKILRDYAANPQGEYEAEYRMRHRDGRYCWFLSRGIALKSPNGKVAKVIGIRYDISERKEIEQHIRLAGQHDPLTGLPNRALLFDQAERILAAARRSKVTVGILFIDLDRFKQINDTHGHDAGDAVLRAVAQRLGAALRRGDIAGRLGGDEFLAILAEVNGAAGAAAVAEQVLARLNQPCAVGDLSLTVAPSIGIALFPRDGDDFDTLVSHADRAMYAAKGTGGGRIEFSTAHARSERRSSGSSGSIFSRRT